MQYNLKRPCAHCPWRSDRAPFFGRDHRGSWDDETGEQVQTDRTQACAGALITMQKGEGPGNLLRMMGRLGFYDPSILDLTAPTYDSLAEWAEAHRPK